MKCSRERERRQHRGRGGGPGPRNLLTPPGAAPPPARRRPPCRAQGPRAARKPGCPAPASAPDAPPLRRPRPGPPPARPPPRNLDNRGPALQSAGREGGGSEAPAGARVPGGRGRGDGGGGSPATLSLRAPGRLHSFPGGAGDRPARAASRRAQPTGRGLRASAPGRGRGHGLGRPSFNARGVRAPDCAACKTVALPSLRYAGPKGLHCTRFTNITQGAPPIAALPNVRSQRPGSRHLPLLGPRGWGPPSPAPPAVSWAIPRARGVPGHRGGVTT